MNKKAFTLVELLAVITILSIVALITIPAVTNTMSKQKEKLYYDQLNQLIMASKNWGADNTNVLQANLGDNCNEFEYYSLKLSTLQSINNGVKYLDEDFVNPKTDENFSDSEVSLKVYKRGKSYLYCVQTDKCSTAKYQEYIDVASKICCDGSDFSSRIECN